MNWEAHVHTLGNLCGGVLQLCVDSILSYLSYDLKLFNYDLECWKYTDTDTDTKTGERYSYFRTLSFISQIAVTAY